MTELIVSRVGTWMDPDVFGRLNEACAADPELAAIPKQGGRQCEHCERPTHIRGLCRGHYDILRIHGDPLWKRPLRECSQPNCHEPAKALGLCEKHYWYVRKDRSKRDERLVEMAEAARIPKQEAKEPKTYIAPESGYRGVSRHGAGWRARCGTESLGIFRTVLEASRAYEARKAATA